MRIPEVQQRLRAMSVEIRCLAAELSRRPAKDKAPVQSRRMTPAVRALIVSMKRKHPTWSYQRIANYVGVNGGRVSETLNGKRR